MRSQSVQVDVPSRLYEEFADNWNKSISTGEKREMYQNADFHNTALQNKLMEECIIPYLLEELGYSEDAQIGARGQIEEPADD